MPMSYRMIAATALTSAAALALPTAAPAAVYADRATFLGALTTSFTDDFGAAYGSGFTRRSDAAMSAVIGQTAFRSTGFNDLNLINEGRYCAGCNGSFILDFSRTSYGTAAGVFGAGIDFSNRGTPGYTAFVTYGDGSNQNIAVGGDGFLGVTSSSAIRSIAFGLPGGGTTRDGNFLIDNLTIGAGAVPEPATWLMMTVGIGLIGGVIRRRPKVSVRFA